MKKDELGRYTKVFKLLTAGERSFVIAFEAKVEALCRRMGLESEAPELDLCGDDVNETSAAVIRLGMPKHGKPWIGDRDADYEARHIFAHWLCNAESGRGGDKIADAIADLLK
jgi:hypothetical protein